MLFSTFVHNWFSLILYPKQTTKGYLPRFIGLVFFGLFLLRSFQLELPPWLRGRRAAAGWAGKTVQIPNGQLLWERLGSWGSEARQGGAEAAEGIRLIPAPREVPGHTAGWGAQFAFSGMLSLVTLLRRFHSTLLLKLTIAPCFEINLHNKHNNNSSWNWGHQGATWTLGVVFPGILHMQLKS